MIQKIFDRCCGCSACAVSCPVGAIHIQPDENGFYKPKVEAGKCVHCGACIKACPVENAPKGQAPRGYYACRATDSAIVKNSSSGGIFPLLAKVVLDEGGSVFGCAWNEEGLAAHMQISNESDLHLLTTSKYLQSRLTDTFQQIKQLLEQNQTVLFCGTPCQIAGLRSFLRKPYAELITVDFICHGVPSPKAFTEYKKELEKDGAPITGVCFRDKEKGWNQLQLTVAFADGTIYSAPAAKDSYYRAFLANLSLNAACGECQFNVLPRASDITLGDFWGVEKHFESFADNAGVSCVIVHSEAGMKLFQKIKDRIQLENSNQAQVMDGNPFLDGHCTLHKRRERFFAQLGTEPFSQVAEKCLKPTRWEWLKEVVLYKLRRK